MKYGIKAYEIMIRNPVTIKPELSVRKALGKMLRNKVGFAIVVDGKNHVVGIVTEGNFLDKVLYKKKDPDKVKVRDIMVKKVITAKPEYDLEEIFNIMRKHKIRRVPIVDSDKTLLGLITESDLRNISPSLLDVMIEKLKVFKPSFRLGFKG